MCFGEQKSQTVPTVSTTAAFVAAQAAAVNLGKKYKFVNAGDVLAELKKQGITSKHLGNAAGSVFSKKLFRSTGTKVKNTNPSAHRRTVTQWEYIGEGASAASQFVPKLGVSPVKADTTYVPVYMDATPQNTKVGASIVIKSQFREKLTGNGKRPYTAKVTAVEGAGARWPVRVEYTNGSRGLLAFNEFQIATEFKS